MADETDPPRKVYGFKERAFKRDNAPATEATAVPSASDLAKLAGPPPAFRQKSVSEAKADDPNDVFAARQVNRSHERSQGLDQIEIRKVKSRKKWDYLIVLVLGNAVIIGVMLVGALNVVSVMFGLSGMIIFNLGVTWAMWQVMGKY